MKYKSNARFYKNKYGSGYLVCTKGGRNLSGKCVPVERRDGRRVPLRLGKRLAPDLYRIRSAC